MQKQKHRYLQDQVGMSFIVCCLPAALRQENLVLFRVKTKFKKQQ